MYRPPYFYGGMPVLLPPPVVVGVEVRPVWANNLSFELGIMQQVAFDALYVAVNVHYPGVIHRAGQDQASITAEQRYAAVKANVDELKPLQVGLAVYNARGQLVSWEINLSDFDAATDGHTARSLSYIAGRGLVVEDLRRHGVPAAALTHALAYCGLVARPGLTWITYSGAYHVAYLLKVITGGAPLPPNIFAFLATVRHLLAAHIFDVARMATDFYRGPVGLDDVASLLGIPPPLRSPLLAGAASVRALDSFMVLRHLFGGDVSTYMGLLQGLQVT
ncbi:hypothetical protein E2562_038711 [Oryza meyeriana var. granulata]|uniref:poly(A)-specific ribonuclease n=1 Tax=Oryza meyeriana var. granulata TaxID=110450 RepID=A0A6G1CXW5_9ORYZ|nr:hypothetical protein E2562_038711 [Oryza meyeriana var. granulata]